SCRGLAAGESRPGRRGGAVGGAATGPVALAALRSRLSARRIGAGRCRGAGALPGNAGAAGPVTPCRLLPTRLDAAWWDRQLVLWALERARGATTLEQQRARSRSALVFKPERPTYQP